MEQNKLLHKPFKQIFHIGDIWHNIVGIPFITNYVPTINILNSKLRIKDKYTKLDTTTLSFFKGWINNPNFLLQFLYYI